jgi:hypothetical protein
MNGARGPGEPDGPAKPDVWRVVSSFRPGERGTKRLLRDWGHRLVCVRYRYNPLLNRRIKTAELIVDEAPWRRKRDVEVGIEIRSWENELRHAIVAAGGKWDRELGVWVLARKQAARLGLEERAKKLAKRPGPDPSEDNTRGNREANTHGNLRFPTNIPGNRR